MLERGETLRVVLGQDEFPAFGPLVVRSLDEGCLPERGMILGEAALFIEDQVPESSRMGTTAPTLPAAGEWGVSASVLSSSKHPIRSSSRVAWIHLLHLINSPPLGVASPGFFQGK